ncbi:MAG: hypothetical protein ISN29_05470 [Gammaproteobacteria bacterium AqS3]|nr:hypothetical protein [Gammaproteobacteria bacterium AqS3]
MWKTLAKSLVAWTFWRAIRERLGQFAFGVIGFFLVYYANGEVREYFELKNNTEYLATLLIVKNAAYLLVLAIFLLWPFLFAKKGIKAVGESVDDASAGDDNPAPVQDRTFKPKGDGFDRIRQRGAARSAVELEIDRAREGK